MTHTEQLHTTSKARLLRELNERYKPKIEALNHTIASATRTLRLEEQDYQRERQQIINSPYYGS
jgi:hypothetical protein